jgi:phosphopantetheinyl transferase (holo-ACP synthase)
MTVIGNDIVNLSDISNKKSFTRKGIEKFYSTDELNLAETFPDLNLLPCFWAMKESAYKCLMKKGLKKAFSPAKYACRIVIADSEIYGSVTYENKKIWTKYTEDGAFVRCIASNTKAKLHNIKSFHLHINEHQDKSSKITNKLKSIISRDIEFYYKLNIPQIINKSLTKHIQISLSNENQLYFISVLPEWAPNKKAEQHKQITYA